MSEETDLVKMLRGHYNCGNFSQEDLDKAADALEQKDAVIADLTESLDEAKYDEPELRSKLDKQRQRIEQLKTALGDVFALIEEGKMVKKVTRDECPVFVQRLRKIKNTLETAGDTRT